MGSALVIDIGNTSTSIGLYRHGRVSHVRRFNTADTTSMKIARATAGLKADAAVIASVVPSVNRIWAKSVRIPVLWLNHKSKLGVPITYRKPATIGADRLANACGGAKKYGTPLIVADFGTAATFDIVTSAGGYVGGIIAPGPQLAFSYLAEKTAKLPLIKPGKTSHRIGKSTREAMQLGARWGYRGLVREILSELTRNPELANSKLVATGGYADWAVRDLKPRMIVDHALTLYGLGVAYELNS